MTMTVEPAVHDVRDRRANTDKALCQKLKNMREDLLTFACNPTIIEGVAYDVARRLTNLIDDITQERR